MLSHRPIYMLMCIFYVLIRDFNNVCAEQKDLSYNVHVKYLLISYHIWVTSVSTEVGDYRWSYDALRV